MAYIKATGSACYNANLVSSSGGEEAVNWDDMGFPYCWLQLYANQPHTIVFDDEYADRARDFIEASEYLSWHLIVRDGDLIETTGYRYDEATKVTLCRARGITLDGKRATIHGSKLVFGIVAQTPDGYSDEWSWEAIRRIVCKGGQFRI